MCTVGISCPRISQVGRSGHQSEGQPFGQDALAFTKEFCLQREVISAVLHSSALCDGHPTIQVEVEVDNMDKAGNFIGWLFIEGRNLSVALVEVRYM